MGDGDGFFFKAADEFGVVGEVAVDEFDGYDAAQVGVGGFIDGGHAALTEQFFDAVTAV